MNRLLILFTVTTALVSGAGCDRQENKNTKKSAPPAKLDKSVKESDLATITLSPEAEIRLGIETAVVAMRRIQRTRTVGGEIVVPPGRQITVSAPLAGTLTAPKGGENPTPGSRLTSGQSILRLSPVLLSDREVLPPSDRISLARARADLAAAVAEVEGEVASAGVQIKAASVKLDRAEKLRKDNVGSVRAYQEAEAELRLAETKAKASQRRLQILKDTNLEAESGNVACLPMESPQDGLLQEVYAVPGEVVAAGAPLFKVAGIDPVWVRVPVYVGDLDRIELQAPAGVTNMTFKAGAHVRTARPVSSPPSADANAATVDLFYELDNAQADLLPGTRVGVILTLKTAGESRVVPWSAILYDINGGTWVYENTEPHVFVHRRVEVRRVVDGVAVLERGPDVGKRIVTSGAVELFGTEFGGSK